MEIKKIKILLCDDSLLVRKSVRKHLEEQGCTSIMEAADGEQAIAMYKEFNPDLVLMDIVMPKKTGIDALKEIKAHDPHAYIVMASSVGTQSKLKEAILAGASDFLQKPFDLSALDRLIQRIQ